MVSLLDATVAALLITASSLQIPWTASNLFFIPPSLLSGSGDTSETHWTKT